MYTHASKCQRTVPGIVSPESPRVKRPLCVYCRFWTRGENDERRAGSFTSGKHSAFISFIFVNDGSSFFEVRTMEGNDELFLRVVK